MDRLQTYLPATVMLPPRRLRTLLKQAVEMQAEKCPCHDMAWETHIENVSLLTDHNCSQDGVSDLFGCNFSSNTFTFYLTLSHLVSHSITSNTHRTLR